MIDLLKQKQNEVAELCRRYNVRRLDVFGSAANGNFDEEKSDIDFFVEFYNHDTPGIFDRYMDLVENLESLFGKKVDLVTAPSVKNPYFRASLETSKESVYAT